MEITTKNHKLLKTKNAIKTNNLILIFNGINQNYDNWVISEQKLKSLNFKYYKVFNKITRKIIKESVYYNTLPAINGVTILITQNSKKKKLIKISDLNQFNLLLFVLIALKLNNNIYSANQLKTLNSTQLKKNNLIFYQYSITNLKMFFH